MRTAPRSGASGSGWRWRSLLVVAGALGVVYMIVVPSLEAELVNAKLDQLEEDAQDGRAGLPRPNRPSRRSSRSWRRRSSSAGRHLHGRSTTHLSLSQGDSNTTSSRDVERDRSRGGPRRPGSCSADTVERRRPPVRRGGVPPAGPDAVDPAQRLARRSALERRSRRSGGCWSRALIGLLFALVVGLRRWRRCTRAGSGGSSARPSGSPAGQLRRAGRRHGPRRARASWRTRSSACASGSRTSTAPGASSSRTRRTSCGRRSSRSAASSS